MTQTFGPKTQIRWAIRSLVFLLRAGSAHPSVLWQFMVANVRYNLIKRGVLSRAAKHVADVHAEFEANAAQGQFKELFFDMADMNIVQWCDTFSKTFDRADPVRILEIGSWEGRSALFLLTYFTQGQLAAVDTRDGRDEYHYNATADLRDLESRFDRNLRRAQSA